MRNPNPDKADEVGKFLVLLATHDYVSYGQFNTIEEAREEIEKRVVEQLDRKTQGYSYTTEDFLIVQVVDSESLRSYPWITM